MFSDVNKGIVNITYNYLNLPDTIDLGNNTLVTYVYDAQGTKLSSTLIYNGDLVTTIYYLNGFVYEDNRLDFIIGDEGRIIYNKGNFFYEYYIKDHLGDVRVCFADRGNGTPIVTQERAYYPFGLSMKGLEFDSLGNAANLKYTYNENKFNGKEFQEFMCLQWYDYGARFYDQQIGRWLSIDPLAEFNRRWSPYSYCIDNPVRFIDPDGMGWWDEIKFALQHPVMASVIGAFSPGSTNISTNSIRFAARIGLREYQSSRMGSEVNAFRHVLWQSTITRLFGENVAEEVGNSHEDI